MARSYDIDFGGVEKDVRKRGRHIPEGDYIAKIVDVERKKNKAGDAYYFNWKFQIVEAADGDKKHAGMTFYYNTSLKTEALFNLRNLIFAASDGKNNVAGRTVNFNPAKLKGKRIGVTVEDDEYEGKIRSAVVDVQPPSAIVDEEDDDDEEDEDDEDDDLDEDDDEDEDEDDDEEDEEEEVKPKKKGKKSKGKKKKDDDDDDDLEEVDDDDL